MNVLFTLIVSLVALIWSANHLVTGAAGLASYYRLSPFVVGFTLIALGCSGPEIMVSIGSSLEGLNNLAIGNAIGSNIANIGFVLGLTALLKPRRLPSTLIRREYPVLVLVMLFAYSLMLDGYLGVLDGCLFLIVCIALIAYFVSTTFKFRPQKQLMLAYQQISLRKRSLKAHGISLLIGLIILPLSTRLLINSCSSVAHWLGVSEVIIGLTIVAFGTSLPELVTSIIALVKGADDIALGTILGSNIINLLAVMIFPSIINPAAVSSAVLWRDIPAMFLTTSILLGLNYHNKKKMARIHGGILILVYACYIASLIISSLTSTKI